MTEIHVGSSQTLFLDLFNETADSAPTATINGAPVAVSGPTSPSTGVERWSIVVGLANTVSEGELVVVWSLSIGGSPVEKTDYFEVVTPYLTLSEVKSIYPEATDAEAAEVEAAVRFVINAHTGQSFGRFVGAKTVEGHGETALRLPERLAELTGVQTLTSNLDPRAFILVSDGWYLKKGWADTVGATIASDSQYWGDYQESIFDNGIYSDPEGDGRPPYYGPVGARPGGVIVPPGSRGRATPWKDDYPFVITGTWGYKKVPGAVKEAAKLLVNDYACGEIAYRDRYLESIKAADWRLQFNERAWEYTGNVRADQLLSEFVILDWAVI